MNDRKLEILFSIINSYILDGEPIGSKSLASEYNMNISPATIRNEMSALEKMGLLEKAHTSSGRLPSDKGYRMFVDYILEYKLKAFKANVSDEMISLLDKRYHNAKDIVETATKLLADMTKLTAVSVTLTNEIKRINNIKLIRVSDFQVLLVCVFDNGLVINEKIYLDHEITSDELNFINNVIEETLVGSDINKIDDNLKLLQLSLLRDYYDLVDIMEKRLESKSLDEVDREVQIEGLGNIFNFKEYDDLSKAREFIKLFDSKDRVNKIIGDMINNDLNISIGYENQIDELKNNTVISSHFKVNNDIVGNIAVVGLTRLNYLEVISNIMMISNLLNK
ncbi:heat-inducible transcriptional repressor HrcA [Anaerococcus sp. Marseille-P3625]|uniref:heat-inducible transcriptional repressor HrcA n=1 Tax=Anaerococcus sp. Marseille-P3625 TaxID=1977277 RepID=UPI000C069673|nr:heat-inducible transcriptional repressor HrcA [Anaerococcus sp. Marseille-P3625]